MLSSKKWYAFNFLYRVKLKPKLSAVCHLILMHQVSMATLVHAQLQTFLFHLNFRLVFHEKNVFPGKVGPIGFLKAGGGNLINGRAARVSRTF